MFKIGFKYISLLIIAGLLATCSFPVYAQNSISGDIMGKVLDSKGKPIAAAATQYRTIAAGGHVTCLGI